MHENVLTFGHQLDVRFRAGLLFAWLGFDQTILESWDMTGLFDHVIAVLKLSKGFNCGLLAGNNRFLLLTHVLQDRKCHWV